MKKLILNSIIILSFLFSSHLYAADKLIKKEFGIAYKAYVEASDENNWEQALPLAKQAYQLGQQYFDPENEQITLLQYNYAYSLLKNNKNEEAKTELTTVLKKFEMKHGNESKELIPVLYDLASSDKMNKIYRTHYKRILNIIKKHDGENTIAHSSALAKIGALLLNVHNDNNSGKYLRQAQTLIEAHHSEKNIVLGSLLFNLGKFELQQSKENKAAQYFESAVTDFEKHNRENSRIALITRAFLVETYERKNQSDKATKHCIAIGKATPINSEQEYMPIYKKAPEYPAGAAHLGIQGHSTVEYEVDALGFTRNHRIVDSSNKALDKASIEAAKNFRYAPQFVDGKAISVKGVKNKFTYKLSRR